MELKDFETGWSALGMIIFMVTIGILTAIIIYKNSLPKKVSDCCKKEVKKITKGDYFQFNITSF